MRRPRISCTRIKELLVRLIRGKSFLHSQQMGQDFPRGVLACVAVAEDAAAMSFADFGTIESFAGPAAWPSCFAAGPPCSGLPGAPLAEGSVRASLAAWIACTSFNCAALSGGALCGAEGACAGTAFGSSCGLRMASRGPWLSAVRSTARRICSTTTSI